MNLIWQLVAIDLYRVERGSPDVDSGEIHDAAAAVVTELTTGHNEEAVLAALVAPDAANGTTLLLQPSPKLGTQLVRLFQQENQELLGHLTVALSEILELARSGHTEMARLSLMKVIRRDGPYEGLLAQMPIIRALLEALVERTRTGEESSEETSRQAFISLVGTIHEGLTTEV